MGLEDIYNLPYNNMYNMPYNFNDTLSYNLPNYTPTLSNSLSCGLTNPALNLTMPTLGMPNYTLNMTNAGLNTTFPTFGSYIPNVMSNPLTASADLTAPSTLDTKTLSTTPSSTKAVDTELPQEEKKGRSVWGKIGIGLLITAAVVGLGLGADHLICKGKYRKQIGEWFKGLRKAKPEGEKPTTPTETPHPQGNQNPGAPTTPTETPHPQGNSIPEAPTPHPQGTQNPGEPTIPTETPHPHGNQNPGEPKPQTNENCVNFSFTSKHGRKYDLNLEKRYYTYDDIYGQGSEIQYIVRNPKTNDVVGTWHGFVRIDSDGNKYIHGHMVETVKEGVPHVDGLGTEIKKLIHQEAVNNGCNRIEIEAAYGSHVFHGKMGYRANFNDDENGIESARKILTLIKDKNVMSEYADKINNVIKSNSVTDMNKLIDEILNEAGKRNLRSKALGILGRLIPMVKYV